MIKKLLLTKFNFFIFFIFLFSGTLFAQSYQINGTTINSSTLNCASFIGKKTISIGDGVNFASLRMDSNLDLTSPNTCILGPIEIIINNNANIDFSVNNSDLKLPAGSSIIFNGNGALYSGTGSQCSASDRIYIGGVLLATCEGKAGAISFTDLVNQGGFNIVAISPSSVSACGSGSFSFTATAIPSAAATIRWYDAAIGGTLLQTGVYGSSSTYTTPNISTTKTYYAEATIGAYTTPRKGVTVTITANNTSSVASSTPTLCINTTLTNITHTTTEATGIGTATGLPTGVTAAWASNTITISGTPAASGTFNYTIPLTGGCGIVNATGTITVNALPNNTSSGFTATTICAGGIPQLTFDADDTTYSTPYSITYKNDITSIQYTVTIPSAAPYTFTPVDNPTSNTGYTLVSISNATCTRTTGIVNPGANLRVRPMPTATISGSTSVCAGTTSPNITFTNPQTVGVTVAYTINGGPTQTVTISASSVGSASSTTNVAVPTAVAGSFVYALVSVVYTTNPSCVQTLTGSATVMINSLPSAPTIVTSQPTCTVATGSISITAVSGETYSFDGSTYSGTLVYSGLAQGSSHTVSAKNASGCISVSVGATITSLVTNTYSGTWSAGSAPPATNGTQNIVFNAGYNATTDLSGCSCQVNSGAVVIKSGHTLSLANELTVSGGSLKFEDNASLIQTNTVITINTGNITYERLTPTIIDNFDYTYWSSPVSPQKLIDVSPNTSLDKFYSFNLTVNDWQQENPNINMTPGVGYIIRGPQTYAAPAPPSLYQASFKGVPNNGVFSVVIPSTPIGSEASALLGNPYPSAIDADLFLKANMATALEGTLYFWTHNTNIGVGTTNLGSGAYAYTSDDYATYNLTGGAATGIGTAATGVNNSVPNGKIASGQAFFAGVNPGGGTVTFNNNMRLSITGTVLDNSQFFKLSDTKSKTTETIEKDRVWLNLFNSQGAFKQTLVGYITGATDEYDNGYDGETFDGNEFVDFYSVNQDKNLVIQGRALPFDETDEVPLGYKTTVVGDFTIAIAQTDGSLATQEIFLEDKITKSIKNLKVGHYTFSSEAGTFNDRFVLRFINANKTLGNSNFETLNNTVLVSNKNKQIKINSSVEIIDKVQIYDLLGRSIYQKMNINTSEFLISNLVSNHEVLLVKIKLQNGHTVTKKIVY